MPKQRRGTRKPRGNANRTADTSPGSGGSKSASRAKSRQARRLPAGRHGLSREDVTNSQRQRLLEAMAVVCARRTYAATTIAEVVESAGVSRATFYELFRDKEDCFVATMDDWIRMLAAAIQPVVYAERDGQGLARQGSRRDHGPAQLHRSQARSRDGGDRRGARRGRARL